MKKLILILLATYALQACSMIAEEESIMENASRKSTLQNSYKNPPCPIEICGETEEKKKTSTSTQSTTFKNPPCYPSDGCY